jgi:prevent-host-death family protein
MMEIMMKTVSAAEANRHFSALLRDVTQGEKVTVTSRGKPVAIIEPVSVRRGERKAAKEALLERLRGVPISGARDWSRADLYE